MALVYNHLKSDRWPLKILLLIFLSCVASTASSTPIIFLSTHNDITCLVLKRLYVIARLEKMCNHFFATRQSSPIKWINLLLSFAQSLCTIDPHPALGILTEMLPGLRHNHIRFHVETAVATKSIEPLYTLWKELCSYRFLGDDLFTQEFCQLMYVVFARCMKGTASMTERSMQIAPYNKSLKREVQSLTPDQARAIAQRFYLIQRLQHAVGLCIKTYGSARDPDFVVMLALWDDIQHYKNIDKLTLSLGICSSLIALLDKKHMLRLTESTSETPVLSSDLTGINEYAALEKLLEYIDTITDNYRQ